MVYAQSHESIPTKINWQTYTRRISHTKASFSFYLSSIPFSALIRSPLTVCVRVCLCGNLYTQTHNIKYRHIYQTSRQACSNQQIHTIDLHCALRAYISHFTSFAHSTEAFKSWKFTVNTYFSNFACRVCSFILSLSASPLCHLSLSHPINDARPKIPKIKWCESMGKKQYKNHNLK